MTNHDFITLGKNAIDLTGCRFYSLLAIGPVARDSRQSILWRCLCDCGNTPVVRCADLRSGHTTSCGCLKKQRISDLNKTHGKSKTLIYHIWCSFIERCEKSTAKQYLDYGGRGITVCENWRNDFQCFYDHVSTLPNFNEKGYSLDRIDNMKGYYPGNVRFSTRKEQNRNTRRNREVTYDNKTQCISAWAEELGIKEHLIRKRLNAKWTVEKALFTPSRRRL